MFVLVFMTPTFETVDLFGEDCSISTMWNDSWNGKEYKQYHETLIFRPEQ